MPATAKTSSASVLANGIDCDESRTIMMKMRTSSEATEVKKGAIPASTFDLPAGYKKKSSPFKR